MAESLKERIRAELNEARRQRDKLKTTVLGTLTSDVKNREIELGHELKDEETIEIVGRSIKRRREAAEQMRAGNRPELAEKEDREAAILSGYLPAALTEAEVRDLVRQAKAAGADNLGAVMGRIMPSIKGRFDGKEANRIVREELG
jgi:uncharacterized protein